MKRVSVFSYTLHLCAKTKKPFFVQMDPDNQPSQSNLYQNEVNETFFPLFGMLRGNLKLQRNIQAG